MLKKIIPASLGAAALAISLSFVAPTAANAGSLSLNFSDGYGSVTIGNRHYDRDRRHMKRYRACSPRKAVRKARRHMGIRHAHVDRVGHRFVIVKGRKRGKRIEVAFKRRTPHCRVAWVERSRRDHRYGGGYVNRRFNDRHYDGIRRY